MFQTLLLVPGQPGILLEHNSKMEAENVLRNVKVATAWHNGGEVTAIPLNYTDPMDTVNRTHILLDLSKLSADKRQDFVVNIKNYITTEQIKLHEGKA